MLKKLRQKVGNLNSTTKKYYQIMITLSKERKRNSKERESLLKKGKEKIAESYRKTEIMVKNEGRVINMKRNQEDIPVIGKMIKINEKMTETNTGRSRNKRQKKRKMTRKKKI